MDCSNKSFKYVTEEYSQTVLLRALLRLVEINYKIGLLDGPKIC